MNCTQCQSETKISKTYPDMWFCSACGIGDYLPSKTIIDIVSLPQNGMFLFSSNLLDYLNKKNIKTFMFQRIARNYQSVLGNRPLEEILPDPVIAPGATIIIPNTVLTESLVQKKIPHSYYIKRAKNNIKSKVLFLNDSKISAPDQEKRVREFFTSPGIKSLSVEFIEGTDTELFKKI